MEKWLSAQGYGGPILLLEAVSSVTVMAVYSGAGFQAQFLAFLLSPVILGDDPSSALFLDCL